MMVLALCNGPKAKFAQFSSPQSTKIKVFYLQIKKKDCKVKRGLSKFAALYSTDGQLGPPDDRGRILLLASGKAVVRGQ